MKRFFNSLVYIFLILVLIPTNVFAFDKETSSLQNRGVYFYEPSCEEVTAGGSGVPLDGTNPQRMFQYLVGQGLTEEQAAGVTGNAMAESGETIDPAAANGTSYRGIFQWDTSVRFPRLVQWAQSQGKNENDFATQLEFAWFEATERGNIDGLKQQQDIAHATWYWGRFFEVAIIGGSTSETPLTNVQHLERRTANAQQVFDQFAGGGATPDNAGDQPDVAEATTIALDPGHGAAVAEYTDEVTGLRDRETANPGETEDVLDVANRVKTKLELGGYTVVMLRNGNAEAINKRQRVELAKQNEADMVVSIHTTPSVNGVEINQVWPQRQGTYREYNGTRITFNNEATATLSEQYANAMAEARTAAEGHEVTTDPNQSTQSGSFSRPGLPSQGNISLLQLWAPEIPWVYNEITQNGPGATITDERKQQYADGIANGVIAAAPTEVRDGGGECDGSSSAGSGDLASLVEAYAWPTYEGRGFTEKKPDYAEAIDRAQSEGRYVGADGIDCGGFVTTIMIDSGFEPEYNVNGTGGNVAGGQTPWLQGNWESLGHVDNTEDLRLGDVAINADRSHTFMYVGELDFEFEEDVASASLNNRAPMAGREDPTASDIEWFRKR